ncbi:hypothetical protein [Bradyrhizobium vignae]|uniref:Uncharacterized protein n=1 Tax=Bradyrhizobium vignae TaxID=1549949 RepID=A0ABS4A228_9BRAD|nr:hypothetical protein [Bradyrhizobium vignae]MBP0114460.1 hypothetical protein [Bradyrhizobium vignae]
MSVFLALLVLTSWILFMPGKVTLEGALSPDSFDRDPLPRSSSQGAPARCRVMSRP